MYVYPHGDRWAVADELGSTPFSEHPTRDAAESAARAHGGTLEVLDHDPTGLQEVSGGDPGQARHESAAADRAVDDVEDQIRLGQSGL